MWWLILCVNLSALRDAQTAGEMLFLDVPVRVFLKEINAGTGRTRKEDHWPQCGCGHINPSVWGLNRTKGGGRAVSAWAAHLLSIFSCPQTWALLVLGPLASLVFLVLQRANGRSRDFWSSRIMWRNSYNQSIYPSSIYLSTYHLPPFGSISLERPDKCIIQNKNVLFLKVCICVNMSTFMCAKVRNSVKLHSKNKFCTLNITDHSYTASFMWVRVAHFNSWLTPYLPLSKGKL